MGLRNQHPLTWKIKGCSDAADGSNAFPGAMAALTNLVPMPGTTDQWAPRPARDFLANFAAAGFNGATVISGGISVDIVAYGLVASLRNPGRDEPFCLNTGTGQFYTVDGITLDNSPTTALPNSTAISVPTFAIVGGRILVTHPGFPGGTFNPDSDLFIIANTHNMSPTLDGFFGANPIYPGQLVAGTNIPASTYVVSTQTVDFNCIATGFLGNNFFFVTNPSKVRVGQFVAGAGVAGFVTLVASNTITISSLLTADLAMTAVSFHGDSLTMSQNATGDASGEFVHITSTGDRFVKFGWFDISGLVLGRSVSTVNGSPNIVIADADATGLQPGLLVSGTGIPANTKVVTILKPYIVVAGQTNNPTDATITINYGTLPGDVPPFVLPVAGQTVTGPGISPATVVTGIPEFTVNTGNAAVAVVSLSQTTTGSAGTTSPIYTFSGATIVTMNAAATATATINAVFRGGTATQPLWDAGDTAINGLPQTPIGVGSYNGRAWFACNASGAPWSDALLPCVRSAANQAFVPTNLIITSAVSQQLQTPITGGIREVLYLFQLDSGIIQVTGDPSNGTLEFSSMNLSTGSRAFAGIVPTTIGLAFPSPEGMRIIDFSGIVSQPIGDGGQGITAPFIHAVDATRIRGAASGDTIRFVLQNAQVIGQPWQEWWFDIRRKVWSGPHSLQTSAIWLSRSIEGAVFITGAVDVPGQIYKSPSVPTGFTDLNEDGQELTWSAQTVLLPDTETLYENSIVEGTLGMTLPSDMRVTVTALDELGAELDEVTISGNYTMPVYGGMPVFGSGLWYAVRSGFHQFSLPWSKTLTFKQVSFRMAGTSRFGFALGNLRLRYQQLGYMNTDFPLVPFDISVPALPEAPVLNGSPLSLQAQTISPQFTVIGAVLAQIAHAGPAYPTPTLKLTFNQNNRFVLVPYFSNDQVGNVSGTTVSPTQDVITEGWLIGHSISDSAGALYAGTYITDIDAAGVTVTISRAAAFPVTNDAFTVEGTNLVTNWQSPIPEGQPVGEIQAVGQGYLTSYLPFLVTVTSP